MKTLLRERREVCFAGVVLAVVWTDLSRSLHLSHSSESAAYAHQPLSSRLQLTEHAADSHQKWVICRGNQSLTDEHQRSRRPRIDQR